MATSGSEPAVVYVKGEDAALVAQATRAEIDELVGPRDAGLVVEEHGVADELDIGMVVDAFTTPPFLVDRRIVVLRDAGRLTAADAGRLAAALANPVPSVHLILTSGGGTVPVALVRAITAAGRVVDTAVGRGRERSKWVADQVRQGPVRLDGPATRRMEDHLGEDLGRLSGMLDSLAAAYGEGALIGLSELEPFLGEAGSVPPWELTDAIDAGDATAALRTLRRMVGPGGRAAPLIVANLHSHFANMLRLDGAGARSGEDAAALLGVRSAFVAKKAMDHGRELGGERVGQAIVLIAEADLDVKGASGLPPDTVLEVLVARLARLGARGRGRTRPAAGGSGARSGRSSR